MQPWRRNGGGEEKHKLGTRTDGTKRGRPTHPAPLSPTPVSTGGENVAGKPPPPFPAPPLNPPPAPGSAPFSSVAVGPSSCSPLRGSYRPYLEHTLIPTLIHPTRNVRSGGSSSGKCVTGVSKRNAQAARTCYYGCKCAAERSTPSTLKSSKSATRVSSLRHKA